MRGVDDGAHGQDLARCHTGLFRLCRTGDTKVSSGKRILNSESRLVVIL